jgi:hypothetical protein
MCSAKPGVEVTLNGAVCEIVGMSNTAIECLEPPGQGAAVDAHIYVGGQATMYNQDELGISYQKPEVYYFDPNSNLPTAGNITVTITGTNFGVSGVIQVVLANEHKGASYPYDGVNVMLPSERTRNIVMSLSSRSQSWVLPPAHLPVRIVSWHHTEIVFVLPEGQGRHKYFEVLVGKDSDCAATAVDMASCANQWLGSTQIGRSKLFNYGQPKIFSLESAVAVADGRPLWTGPTKGAFTLTLHGDNFGLFFGRVLLY